VSWFVEDKKLGGGVVAGGGGGSLGRGVGRGLWAYYFKSGKTLIRRGVVAWGWLTGVLWVEEGGRWMEGGFITGASPPG